jgi:hypothetical protein
VFIGVKKQKAMMLNNILTPLPLKRTSSQTKPGLSEPMMIITIP